MSTNTLISLFVDYLSS